MRVRILQGGPGNDKPLWRKWSARPAEDRKEPVRFRRGALRESLNGRAPPRRGGAESSILSSRTNDSSGAPSGRVTALQAEISGFNSRHLHCQCRRRSRAERLSGTEEMRVRFPPTALGSRVETEIIRASEARVASSILAESTIHFARVA